MRPKSMTSIGGTMTVAPSSTALAASASSSDVLRYCVHIVGIDASITGMSPATGRPWSIAWR